MAPITFHEARTFFVPKDCYKLSEFNIIDAVDGDVVFKLKDRYSQFSIRREFKDVNDNVIYVARPSKMTSRHRTSIDDFHTTEGELVVRAKGKLSRLSAGKQFAVWRGDDSRDNLMLILKGNIDQMEFNIMDRSEQYSLGRISSSVAVSKTQVKNAMDYYSVYVTSNQDSALFTLLVFILDEIKHGNPYMRRKKSSKTTSREVHMESENDSDSE